MKKALNQQGILINILESNECDSYNCPVCSEKLTRKFGAKNQFFAHPSGKGKDCELKLEAKLKEENIVFEKNKCDTLQDFYDKKFDDVKIQLSDYMSNDGYYLTRQQKDIIMSTENRVVISALSGSAKSSTLYYYAKERPFRRFIYIVYNKSQKDEADSTIGKLKNVEVKTVHGLAYKYVGKLYQSKLTFNYGVIDIIKDLRLDWNRDMQLASQIKEFMTEFMLSDCKTFDELDILENLKPHERKIIISNCEKLWTLKKEYKNNVKVEHDFYLKLFQLGEVDLSDTYDGLLLDESQDSSLLTLSVVLNSNIENIVIVGDMYQSLYKWRKSVNIMSLLKDSTEYKLTTSFRVSQNIAELSNMIVNTMIGDSINMSGFNSKQIIVDSVDRNKPYAILCRTNAMILGEVIDNSHKKIFYNGGFKGYNFNNIKDAYYFSIGKATKNPLFTKFKSYREMIEYAELVKDLELLSIDKVLQKYGSRIPNIVDNLEKNSTNDSDKCDIWISTVHKSKGSTIKLPLVISNDHYDLNNYEADKTDTRKQIDFFSECCIIYVAITRASGQIELSDSLKMYLLNKLGEE